MAVYLSEVFTSVQGEGIHAGQPSTFARIFGCNFTCSGFSAPVTPETQEENEEKVMHTLIDKRQDPREASTIAELDGDQFRTGCDSRYSWHPDYKHLQTKTTPEGLADIIKAHLADTGLRTENVDHLVLTGGEPLMHQKTLETTLMLLPFTHLTFETNCSIPLTLAFQEVLLEWLRVDRRRTVLFSNSPKLAHSGEPREKRINAEAARSQRDLMTRALHQGIDPRCIMQTFKYVVGADEDDFVEAKEMHYILTGTNEELTPWKTLRSLNSPMAMPLGATYEQYRSICGEVAELCLDYGFRYCARIHLELFGNRTGT